MRINGAEAVKLALKRLKELELKEPDPIPSDWQDQIMLAESYDINEAGSFAAKLQKEPFL